jgi:cytoskeletal protein RodZ
MLSDRCLDVGEGRSVSVMPSKQIIIWAAVIAAVLLTPVDAQQGAQTPHDNVRSTTSVRSSTGVRFRRSRPNPDGPTTTRRRGTFPGTKPVNTEPATLRPATVPATARTTIRSIPDPTVATAPTVPHTATSRPVTTTAKAHDRYMTEESQQAHLALERMRPNPERTGRICLFSIPYSTCST